MGEVSGSTAQYTCTIAGQPLDVLSFSVDEAMSRLFRVNLTVWAEDPAVAISAWMRQPAAVVLSWGGLRREYHGIVVSACRDSAGQPGLGGVDAPWGQYTVEVMPSLWLLAQQTNCKVFQDLSAVDIITSVLDARGMAGKYELRLSGSYPKRGYCVQYRESDLDFVSRLMEEEGIFYYFTHDGCEKMVLGDAPAAYGVCAPVSTVEYRTPTGVLQPSQECLSSIVYSESAYAGKVRFKDRNYRTPRSPLKVEQLAEQHTDLEVYDFHPERYLDDGRGRGLARVRGEAESLRGKRITASGDCRSIASGCTITITRAYHPDLNGEWLVVSVCQSTSQEAVSGVVHSMTFEGVPAQTTFRPYPVTPKPTLTSQTATVVGPVGEKIYMDELGRAKVQFDWDRDGQLDEGSSCWIRVAMPYAGIDEPTQAKHGFQWHPLIGDEVVVTFLESDPDRPVITGSVYNQDRPPIVKPEELIRSVILTPYQHRIQLDDARQEVGFETGGGQNLWMGDDAHGWIELETKGEQYAYLWDNDEEWGNLIDLQTSDGHEVELTKCAEASRIRLDTEKRHWLDLNDRKEWVELATTGGHYLNMCDAKDDCEILLETIASHQLWMCDLEDNTKVGLYSAGGHALELDDTEQRIGLWTKGDGQVIVDDELQVIQLSSPGTDDSTEWIEIDWELHTIRIRSEGTVSVEAGQVDISAGGVSVTADGDLALSGKTVTIKGETVDIDGSSSVSVSGGQVSVDASSTLELSGTGEVTIEGGMVTSSANGVNSLKGTIVKLN